MNKKSQKAVQFFILVFYDVMCNQNNDYPPRLAFSYLRVATVNAKYMYLMS